MKSLAEILAGFEAITLEQLGADHLLERTDTKFYFDSDRLPALLLQLMPFYRVLSVSHQLISAYSTQYFDTAGFAMYLDHHNGRAGRYKIRQRTYLETGKTFLEIKAGNRPNKTSKKRMRLQKSDGLWQKAELDFIAGNTPYNAAALRPSLNVNYRRITLVNKAGSERVTIDLDLMFTNAASSFKLNGLTVLEVKQPAKARTPVLKYLHEAGLKPLTFSKYCAGINYLYPRLKKNNFKHKLNQLNKHVRIAAFNMPAGS